MNTILEQIIHQVLLEQRPVASIKQISNKEWSKAKAAGAVYAYSVKVKRVSNLNQIPKYVIAATLTSIGEETDDVVSVGEDSKYATEDYVYVMSDPDDSRRNQKVLVYILPNPFKDFLRNGRKEDNIHVKLSSYGHIGSALFMDQSQYNGNLMAAQLPQKELQIDIDKEIPNDSADQSNISKTTDSSVITPEPSLTSEPEAKKVFTYPYEFTNKDGKEFTIYTLNDTDPFVYIFTDNNYWKTDKNEFEASKPNPVSMRVTDEATINKLNTLTGNKVTVNKEQPKPEEKKKDSANPVVKKKERTFRANEKLKLNSTPIYSYNVTNNVFKKIGKYTTTANDVIEYRRKSSDKKYVQVYFVKEKKLVWVPISAIK